MGCGGSTEAEPVSAPDVDATPIETAQVQTELVKDRLEIAEQDAVKTKAGSDTFIASCLKARAEHSDDKAIVLDTCTRLQAHNRRLKEYVAIYDCETVNEAMNGGFLGLGCNDDKLIAALCTRTKSQLTRTRQRYRTMYDKDLRAEVKGEADSRSYGRMMFFAMAAPDEYVADIIDLACKGMGCDELMLLEVFVTHTQAELQAGKKKWEGRTDKSLVDYLKGELDGWIGNGFIHLRRLLFLLFQGERVETTDMDEELAAKQVDCLHEEFEKGFFEDFHESFIIDIIGKNTTNQNQLVAQMYEKKFETSLTKALKGKCGERLFDALHALIMPKPEYVAMRLKKAMEGWGRDSDVMTRMLGGFDGDGMAAVAEAFERKYGQPLWSALKEELKAGNFLNAATAWLSTISSNPARSAERFTELDLSNGDVELPKLVEMLDWLFVENEALLSFIAFLDVETVREATKGWGTDDTALIRAFTTRNKRALARVNIGYRNKYGEPLQKLIENEMKDNNYSFLAKFLVVQAEQADLMILDQAMDGMVIDHGALVEFLCARHPRRVRAAKAKWEGYHDDSLIDKLDDVLSGDMQTLAMRMLKGKRDVDNDKVDDALARKQAHQLHDSAIDYIETLCDNSAPQNALVAKYYEEAYDSSLRRAISQEYSGPVKDALLALLQGPAEWYAAQLRKALSGDETNELVVCRILGAHDKDEIKEIKAKYEEKYDTTLKLAISSKCKGNYKRLAVAWVELPDQLEQPAKKIELPTNEEISKAGVEGSKATSKADDEISDDETLESGIKSTSPLFKAKCQMWTAKYKKYNEMGKARKAAHYQRLLLLNPPLPKKSSILKGFADALEEEYKKDNSGDDWTGMWLDSVDEAEFEAAGTSKDFFKKWFDVTESMVAEKKVSVKEMEAHWGLIEEPPKQERLYEPVPLAPVGMPVAQSMPMAQSMPQATPAYGSNYAMAQANYAMPVASPYAMPVASPYAMPNPYGNPYGNYGQPQVTSTYTTTSTTFVPLQQPMHYGQQPTYAPQPMMYR
eukprot:jgi/Chrpa1/1951/Chrysochromulina_OHIO_Genome00013467-RA